MARNVTEQELDALLARPGGKEPTADGKSSVVRGQPGVDGAQLEIDTARASVETRDFRELRWLAPEDLEAFQRPARGAGASVVEGLRAALPHEVDFDGVEVAEDSLDSGLREPLPDSVAIVSDGPSGPSLAILELRGALSLAELALGAGDAAAIAARALSPLEAEIVERLLAQAFTSVAQAFGVSAKEPRFVSDPAELARVLGSEGDRRRVAVRVAIALGENKFVLHFLLAGVASPPRKPSANAREKSPAKAALPAEIGSTRVEVSAILAELEIMLTDLLALEAGDMIPLTVAPGEPILLRIEGEPCGRARFGERDGRVAVRLTEILRPSPTR